MNRNAQFVTASRQYGSTRILRWRTHKLIGQLLTLPARNLNLMKSGILSSLAKRQEGLDIHTGLDFHEEGDFLLIV